MDYSVPEWVQILVRERFFTPCPVHESAKKNEKTFFCLCCRESFCTHCLVSSHGGHCFVQIRRYVYHDVIRLDDAEKWLNCSLVQAYTTNSAKVVFLKERPMTRQLRGGSNLCFTCCRTLQHPYLFCSLSCKIHHRMTEKTAIHRRPPSKAQIPSLSELQEIPNSVLELDFPCRLTASVATGAGFAISPTGRATAYSAAGKLVKKKRSCGKSVTAVLCPPALRCFSVAVNRRKGVPQRSPLS